MPTMHQPTPEPGRMPTRLSVDNDGSIQVEVIKDMVARRKVGIEEYGTALFADNGRDALRDAYEEALDLACYLKQAIVERDNAGA